MGWINIRTITNSNECFWFEIESDGLYKINCLPGKVIESLDRIWDICIFQDMLVIRTEARYFRNGDRPNIPVEKDDRSENNILAYDFQGNFLWNIGSIVGDIKKPFFGVSCIFKEKAEKKFKIIIPCDTEILLECNTEWGDAYLVDPINKKLLYMVRCFYRK